MNRTRSHKKILTEFGREMEIRERQGKREVDGKYNSKRSGESR